MDPKSLGKIAEEIAQNFFEKKGYKLLEKNFRIKLGEIDLIFEKRNVIVFIEVKARTCNKYGLPQEAVTPKKQEQIRKVALAYLQKLKKDYNEIRFDVIAITVKDGIPQIEHISNAF